VLKLNTEVFTASANAYDSLGEAYAAAGQRELAIASYQKSLALDPRNANAVDQLKKLGAIR
jgi:tetratricopeptide (TPR) repeat protein